jgi:hypothetical protein
MIQEGDQEKLSHAIREFSSRIRKITDDSLRAPAVRVIDCVLSLNRPYKFAFDRARTFGEKHPEIRSITDLKTFMAGWPSAQEFVRDELNYNHRERADTLSAVVSWLAGIAGSGPDQAQLLNLEKWSSSAKPEDCQTINIRGFKLAGFQYLRILFGANTAKPDVHIIGFVSSQIGHKVTANEALRLLEGAAVQTGIHLRDLDGSIWEDRARAWV